MMLQYCWVTNAKVGYEDQERPVVGKYSLHRNSIDNGLRLTGLASVLNMMTSSTTFLHKKIH